MVLESKLPPGFRSVTLARLPLCLLVIADQRYHRAADLLKEGAAGKVPLISLPPHVLLPRLFQKEMVRRNIVWRTAMETSSQNSVSIYVRNGLGAGLRCRRPSCNGIGIACVVAQRLPDPASWRVLARQARRDCSGIRRRTDGEGKADLC